jgi:putative oxidoreductase
MQVGLFLMHAVIGALLVGHGAQKLFGILGGYGLDGTAGYMEAFDLRPGRLFATAAGGAELVGGSLLAAGLLTPLAAALIAATMIVAARTDHAGKGLWIFNGGAEYVLTVAAVTLGLAFSGAGAWSLDAAMGLKVSGLAWGLGAAGTSLLGAGSVLALRRRARARVREPGSVPSAA